MWIPEPSQDAINTLAVVPRGWGSLPHTACPELLGGRLEGRGDLSLLWGKVQLREKGKGKRKRCPASATRGSCEPSNRQDLPLATPPTPNNPKGSNFPEVLPRATPGFAKICMLFDNYILIIKQFYRLPALCLFFLFRPPCHQPTFSLDKRAQRQDRVNQLKGTSETLPGSPPHLLEEETAPGKRGQVQGIGGWAGRVS